MKLFYKSGACSLSPHIVLQEAGLDFTLEQVDLAQKKTENGTDFLKINPKGQIPALLLDDGNVLTEGVAIVQYIADSVPERHLIPPVGTLSRYHAIEWLNYIATELHKGFGPLFNPQTPSDYKTMALKRLDNQFQYLETVFAKQDYALGAHFSVADAYLFTVLRWTVPMKLDLEKYSHLSAYFSRIAARPAVISALTAEGLV